MASTPKRFKIALSFPGEYRTFVAQVADELAGEAGRESVLYDQFYEAEFARPDLDTYLQALYHDNSELIAVFLCAEYASKDWCKLEWRAIRDLIRRRPSEILLLRFDDAEIPGLYLGDGYIDIGDRDPREIAEKILERHTLEIGVRSSPPKRGGSGKIAPSRLRHAAAHLFGREDELASLHAAWKNPRTHVVTLVAWGGVGKTSLVARWQAELAAREYDGARYLDWSFYSQGTREKGGPSSDAFVAAALRFFGDSEMADSAISAWDKGARLATLVAEERTLLVLDGLEPLQHPPGPLAGQLQDPAITALLRGLAGSNPGLCVVTTREPVVDLRAFQETTAPEWSLRRLSVPAGVALLEKLGVHGTTTELEQLVEDIEGHALTLNLIGEYLARAHGGDVRRRDRVALEEANPAVQGGHAFRVMDAYVTWLEAGGEQGARQLAVLRLLGLFDRPATDDCIRALRAEPAIPGLTEPLVGLPEVDWNLTLHALADGRLIARREPDDTSLDAHPLIREYFATNLRNLHPEAWRQAHSRLFDYLRASTEHQPDTLEGLQPLYQAVRHGCEAGRHEEARANVYRDRILRGSDAYSTFKLGAIGADLGAVACFFETPWSNPVSIHSEASQAWLLNEAAFSLRALGRLTEAAEPLRAGLESYKNLELWANAAGIAGNLSELELVLGDVESAVGNGELSTVLADRSAVAMQRFSRRAAHAYALLQAGQRDEARALFREAETIQAEAQPRYPLLYSLRGFQYCELLLADAEREAWRAGVLGERGATIQPVISDPDQLVDVCHEVEGRGQKMFEWRVPGDPLLDIALDHLSLGRARLYRVLLEHPSDPKSQSESVTNARNEIEQAVDGFRRAGTRHHVSRGLLTRALLRALTDNPDGARTDLDEAWEIAERGPMPLFMADIQLHRARLFRDRDALAEARRLIEKHGYGRRLGELEDAESVADSWP